VADSKQPDLKPQRAVLVGDTEGPRPDTVNNDFGKYVDFQPLTSGGKATLQTCKDTNLGRTVVIKQVRDEFVDDPREISRLLREARITAQMGHTGTVPIYEVGQDDKGRWYFTMKKVDGENLFKIIVKLSQKEPVAVKYFTLNRLLNIFCQVCDCLDYAHSRGVIHRDVKPENIVVGFFGEAILLDWGVAKVWGMPNESDEDTIHDRGGSPLYMSPEQVLGHKHIDERTDVFSMGIVLYELLAIREPFRGREVRETFDNIVNETPPPPSEVARNGRFVPKPLDAICLKALEKDPADRYQSIRAMATDVEDYVNNALMRDSTKLVYRL